LPFRLGDYQPGEESAASAIQRPIGLVPHDLGMIVVLAQVSQNQGIDGRIQV
jgi:hypothetical protein